MENDIKHSCAVNIKLNINCPGYNKETESKIINHLVSNLSSVIKDEVSKIVLPNGKNLRKDDICVEGKIILSY
jgi:hypothetical protein